MWGLFSTCGPFGELPADGTSPTCSMSTDPHGTSASPCLAPFDATRHGEALCWTWRSGGSISVAACTAVSAAATDGDPLYSVAVSFVSLPSSSGASPLSRCGGGRSLSQGRLPSSQRRALCVPTRDMPKPRFCLPARRCSRPPRNLFVWAFVEDFPISAICMGVLGFATLQASRDPGRSSNGPVWARIRGPHATPALGIDRKWLDFDPTKHCLESAKVGSNS